MFCSYISKIEVWFKRLYCTCHYIWLHLWNNEWNHIQRSPQWVVFIMEALQTVLRTLHHWLFMRVDSPPKGVVMRSINLFVNLRNLLNKSQFESDFICHDAHLTSLWWTAIPKLVFLFQCHVCPVQALWNPSYHIYSTLSLHHYSLGPISPCSQPSI